MARHLEPARPGAARRERGLTTAVVWPGSWTRHSGPWAPPEAGDGVWPSCDTLYLMSALPSRRSVRDARRTLGLTQAQLAERSGTSRIRSLAWRALRPVTPGSATVAAVCERSASRWPSSSRGSAETSQTLLRTGAGAIPSPRSASTPCRLADLLSLPNPKARELISRARKVVDQWERDRTCSHHYISRWRALLGGGSWRRHVRCSSSTGGTGALFQNSPGLALGPRRREAGDLRRLFARARELCGKRLRRDGRARHPRTGGRGASTDGGLDRCRRLHQGRPGGSSTWPGARGGEPIRGRPRLLSRPISPRVATLPGSGGAR